MKRFIITLLILVALLPAQDNLTRLSNLGDNTWIKLPATGDIPDEVRHTAMVVDHNKARLYFYGSDTHSNLSNYNNTIWSYDIASGVWSTLYAPDDLSTYTKDAQFYPITQSGRPVASHVFDGMDYISSMHCMIVIQNPKHAGAQPFGGPYDDIIWSVRRPTLWLYNTDTNTWTLCKKRTMTDLEIFINASAYAPDYNAFFWENRGTGMYRFDLADSTWALINGWGRGTEYHTTMAYDNYSKQLLIRPGLSSRALYSYNPADSTWDTLSSNTFYANGIAMDFDEANNVLITVGCDSAYTNNYYATEDGQGRSLTNVYDVKTGQWSDPAPSGRPPCWGFNFKGAYDPVRNVFFYLEKPSGSSRLDVWAYRYKRAPIRVEQPLPMAFQEERIIGTALYNVRGIRIGSTDGLPAGVYIRRIQTDQRIYFKRVLITD